MLFGTLCSRTEGQTDGHGLVHLRERGSRCRFHMCEVLTMLHQREGGRGRGRDGGENSFRKLMSLHTAVLPLSLPPPTSAAHSCAQGSTPGVGILSFLPTFQQIDVSLLLNLIDAFGAL